jgi:RNA-directed DNA polymerase
VEIPKPDGSGMRKLGIPCVLDRFVQQAVHKAQQYIAEGYRWVVDLDLENFSIE